MDNKRDFELKINYDHVDKMVNGGSGLRWQLIMSPDIDEYINEEEYYLVIKALELASNELKRQLATLKRENLKIKNEIGGLLGKDENL